MPTTAEVIAEGLARAGCRHAFGIPGGEVLAMMQALDGAGLEFTLCKHENAGGFMAEGAWHATGAPGVLLATIGPGVVNAINVIANAWQDRVPLIFLTGCADAYEAETYTHQVFDHQAVLRPITKATFRAAPETAAVVIEKALLIARDGRPGPVHIDLPIGAADVEARPLPPSFAALPAPVAPAEGPDLADARAILERAKRPLVISGVDAVNEGAADAVARFCRHLGAPLITTYKGKGLIPEADPLCLGGHGLSPKSDRLLAPVLEAADAIVLAGYDPIEMRTGWRNPWPDETPVIEIAAETSTHFMHRPTIGFVADVAAGLEALSSGVTAKDGWPDDTAEEVRDTLRREFAPDGDWGPGVVFDVLRHAVPDDTVITADSGAHRILLSQMWPCFTPRTLLQSSALCTMGCAVPLAAGYRAADKDTPLIAFVGDAGLEMMLGDLTTVRDIGGPLLIVVLVDESLALIELKQRNSQRPNLGVDFPGADYPAVARALGGEGVWIDDADTLRRETETALNRDGFTLLACRIGRHAYDGAF